jgi:hypothetical protein
MLFLLCIPATSSSAQERCPDIPVDVVAISVDERRLACSAASDALELLGRCNISLRRPLKVEISSEVRLPFGSPMFGLFDLKQEKVLVSREANIPSLVAGTPYSALPSRAFYRSVIVHEIVHGVMHQNFKRHPTTRAAYEYPAYALQIESLPSNVRNEFLRSIPNRASTNDFVFSDSILLFDPFFFAARAYTHFKASPDRCRYLIALLEGVASSVPLSPQ